MVRNHRKNVFIICKTPRTKQITKRTLLSYKDNSINIHYFEDFIGYFKNQLKSLVNKKLKGECGYFLRVKQVLL